MSKKKNFYIQVFILINGLVTQFCTILLFYFSKLNEIHAFITVTTHGLPIRFFLYS